VGQGTTFSIPGPSDVTGATTRIAAENFNENKTLGFYAQEQVNIKDRVFLTAAIRATTTAHSAATSRRRSIPSSRRRGS
jgi:hypothetical protein